MTNESLVGRWVPESRVRTSVVELPGGRGTREVNRAEALFSARRAALDGTTLVLLRASGEEIGRLIRRAA